MKRYETYKAIFTADLHLSNMLPHAKPVPGRGGITDRFLDQLNVLDQIWEYSSQHDADVWILGDLFDRKNIDAITLLNSITAIERRPKQHNLHILPGNHDAVAQDSEYYMVGMFREAHLEGIDVLDAPIVVRPQVRTKLSFMCVPYASLKRSLEAIRHEQQQLGENDTYLLLHNSILGAEQGGWTCDVGLDPTEISQGFKGIFAGHFHRHQDFYLGAPMQLNYGEEDHPTQCWLITFTPDHFEMKSLEIEAPRFHTFRDLSYMPAVKKGDYVRWILESTKADWEKVQLQARAICESANAAGIKATYMHKPIYQHVARLDKKRGDTKVNMLSMMRQYVTSSEVVLGDLDAKRLEHLGEQALTGVGEKA